MNETWVWSVGGIRLILMLLIIESIISMCKIIITTFTLAERLIYFWYLILKLIYFINLGPTYLLMTT